MEVLKYLILKTHIKAKKNVKLSFNKLKIRLLMKREK